MSRGSLLDVDFGFGVSGVFLYNFALLWLLIVGLGLFCSFGSLYGLVGIGMGLVYLRTACPL